MISHLYRTIFVHIPKTGGQSVETLFLEAEGLSWEERAPLLLRHNPDPALGPQQLAHLYAREYTSLGHIAPDLFQTYFKFAVVRNPFTRAVSEYRYRYPGGRVSFRDFLTGCFETDYSDKARHLVPQTEYLRGPEGGVLVDSILRFETLQADMASACTRLFGEARALPHRNPSTGNPDFAAKPMSDIDRDLIRARYADDFSMFGYSTTPA